MATSVLVSFYCQFLFIRDVVKNDENTNMMDINGGMRALDENGAS